MTPQTRGLLLGLTAILIGLPLMGWTFFLTHMVPDGHTDFRVTYTAGYMLRTGHPLYDYAGELKAQNRVVSREEIALPFLHPAYEALIYVPLSFVTYPMAYWLWFAINIVILTSIYYLLRPELEPLSEGAFWLPIASLAAYLPFGAALVQGQDSLLLVFLFSAAFVLLRSEDQLLLAGMCLGLASFRFQIVVPIIACFLLWRRWKLVAGFLATTLPLAILSVFLAGFWPYVNAVLGFTGHKTAALQQLASHMPNLRGLIHSAGGGNWLTLALSFLVLASAALAGRGLSLQLQMALAVTVGSLVSYYGLVHDLSVLFVPCAYLFARKTGSALAIAAVVFFSPALLIFAPDHFYLAALGGVALFVYLAMPSLESFSVPVVRVTENAG
jgi:alpha-1,2-mannosyltransferase